MADTIIIPTTGSGDSTPKVETLDLGTDGKRQVVQASRSTNPSASFTRPANTTAYVSGQLLANSVTAGSVAAMQHTCQISNIVTGAKGTFHIVRAVLKKSTTATSNAAFRIHFWGSDPAASTGVVNGDGATMQIKSGATYLGYVDIPSVLAIFSDGAIGVGQPSNGPLECGTGLRCGGVFADRGAGCLYAGQRRGVHCDPRQHAGLKEKRRWII